MPFTDATSALAARAEKIASDLHRNWITQLIVGFTGLLYLVNPDSAASLASTLRLRLELVNVTVPVISLYLFAKMGYLLAGYLIVRSRLREEFEKHEQPDAESLIWATLNHGSIYQYIATLTVGESISRIRRFSLHWWATLVPTTVIIVVATGLFYLTNAVAIYFFFSLSDSGSPWTRFGTWAIGAVIFGGLYAHFGIPMTKHIGWWVAFVWVGLVVTLVVSVVQVVADPLSAT